MLNLYGHRLRTQVELAGLFGRRNLRVQRRPLSARLAALEAESELPAGGTAVARAAVNCHAARVNGLVSRARGAVVHDLEVVVAGQARNIVGARHAHLVLGLGVVRLELGERERPVEQVRAAYSRVMGLGLEFMFLQTE